MIHVSGRVDPLVWDLLVWQEQGALNYETAMLGFETRQSHKP